MDLTPGGGGIMDIIEKIANITGKVLNKFATVQ